VRAEERRTFDIAVVGGGLVGLAVAREAAARGASVVLLEREQAVAASASGGNTGLGHTGYDAPEGSLERRLLRRAISLHPALYRSFGMGMSHCRKCGSLVVAWTPAQLSALDAVLQENVNAGDMDAYRVNAEELRDLEPALSRAALGAVVCPNEAVVEPFLIPIGYAESARRHGAELLLSTEVTSVERQDGVWRIGIGKSALVVDGRSKPGELLVQPLKEAAAPSEAETVSARCVVNCAGLWGDELEAMRLGGGEPPFHVTPRKGQFLVFDTDVEVEYILETVPTQFTKGVIVWSTIYGNVIVGPTATNQTNKADRSTDEETINNLKAWAVKAVPALKDAKVLGTYSGLRPATEFRDYQIKAHPEERWITVGGIRSTGLTACCAIGEYVMEMVEDMDGAPQPDRLPERPMLGVSGAKKRLVQARSRINLEPVPSLAELAADFRSSGDGTVLVYGRRWLVSHPLSSFGMESYSGKQGGVTS